MMADVIIGTVNEESESFIKIVFEDEDENSVIPDSAWYSLTDKDGDVINGRSEVNISSLAATTYVRLTPEDTSLSVNEKTDRVFTIHYVYDSTLGNDIEKNRAVTFSIVPLVAIPTVS